MLRKKPPKSNQKPQRERFIEAAREAGANETDNEFERALSKIVPPKRRKLSLNGNKDKSSKPC